MERRMAERFPPRFADGLRRFNAGAFFEAHECFEALLDEVEADGRWELLVALVQVAVGYHKAASGHPGPERMLALGRDKLAAFPAVAWGLDVDALRRRLDHDLGHLRDGRGLGERLASDPPRLVMRRGQDSA
jgi:hypothetical protein